MGRKLIRPQMIETTVAGACYLAGLGVGLWAGPADLRKIWSVQQEFTVRLSASARRRRHASWQAALARALL